MVVKCMKPIISTYLEVGRVPLGWDSQMGGIKPPLKGGYPIAGPVEIIIQITP